MARPSGTLRVGCRAVDDSPLTARGLAQANHLAAWARRAGIRRLVASPLGRAQVTARRIAEACGAAIETREALAEMSFGACAGLTLEECERRHPGLLAARAADRWGHRWPQGECFADAVARVRTWLAAEPDALAGEGVAVVAHQGVNRALRLVLTGCSPELALAGDQSASQAIEVAGGEWVLHEIAPDTPDAHAPGVI